MPLSTFYELERAGEGPVRLYVHTHVRGAPSSSSLWTLPEKKLFQRLIGVSGIGPRLAQVILSGMAPGDLVAAIAAGDLGRLDAHPGVGKKTAERLVVDFATRSASLHRRSTPPRRPCRRAATTSCSPWSTWATRRRWPSGRSPRRARSGPESSFRSSCATA